MIYCPVCHSSSHPIFQKHSHWIHSCESCKHRFTETPFNAEHITHVYNDDYFHGGKAGYPDYLRESKILYARGQYYADLIKPYSSPGSILDVGAAAGFILKGFIDSGWNGTGLEPNSTMVEYARNRLSLEMEMGSLEEYHTSQIFDLVTMIQVVPHFYDIRKAFATTARITRNNGFWLIETWDKDSLLAKLLGKRWHEYSPPSVLHWFSKKTLTLLANQFGFRLIARGRPQKKINGAHAKSLLMHKDSGEKKKKIRDIMINKIPDEKVFPYPAFDLFWILFQKNGRSEGVT
ncbi:MAG: class I SAM-dependent methyltransferase [Candidatus Aminicenantes bacterium]|nr:class I SAM-dependent methyltransferase [Candidatus Aminicenantes bacterium]